MNKLRIIIISFTLFTFAASAQYVAMKSNVLYDAITIPNLGVEVSLNRHFTMDISGNYNGWDLSNKRSLKHWMLQPELRYWPIDRFNGHFIGIHGGYMDYVFKKVKLPFGMNKNHGYDGFSYGGGISYGYQLYLSTRWNMEFTAGVGYGYFEYDKFRLTEKEPEYLGLYRTHYWGLTKAGISIIYLIK